MAASASRMRSLAGTLGHDHRLEAAVAITRHRQRHLAVLGQHRLVRMAVAAVARATARRVAPLVAQVVAQLGAQSTLQKRLLQLSEQPVIAQKRSSGVS